MHDFLDAIQQKRWCLRLYPKYQSGKH